MVGDLRKFVAALIVPVLPSARGRGRGGGASVDARRRSWCADPRWCALYQPSASTPNRELARFEQVKRFTLLPHELIGRGGELTPTLKIRRKVVAERYRELIDRCTRRPDPGGGTLAAVLGADGVITSWPQLLAAALVLGGAAFVYVLLGFGAGLVAVGALALILPDLRDVVVLLLLLSLPAEGWVVFTQWRWIRWRGVLLVAAGVVAGIPVGTWALGACDPTCSWSPWGRSSWSPAGCSCWCPSTGE